MLYFVGLGLGDAKDITVKGLEIVRKCSRVYLEAYTSILTSTSVPDLEEFYGKKIILADRDLVESGADEILRDANFSDVAFLVVGDPFGATTHSDLDLRAKEAGIQTKSIHNASIMNAIGVTGLQLYNFGSTVSIPFWDSGWEPDSFFEKISENLFRGLHTLCLLDIKVKEQTIENLMKGKKIYEPPRYMSTQVAAQQLLAIIERKKKDNDSISPNEETEVIAVARIGSDSQKLVSSTLKNLVHIDMGSPLHSLVIIGETHELERNSIKNMASDHK